MYDVKFIARKYISETGIALRLSRIVTGGDSKGIPFKKENGSWVLNVGNDWFMEFEPETREVTLKYRLDTPGMLEGMRAFLESVLG